MKTAALPEAEKGLSLPDERYGYGVIQPLAALEEDISAGSKYGPLAVPDFLKVNPSTPEIGMSDEEQAQADRKALLAWTLIGVVGLGVAFLTVILIVKRSRDNRKNIGGPGGAVGNPNYGQQPLPSQQSPYYQQQATSPHNQWPPQQ